MAQNRSIQRAFVVLTASQAALLLLVALALAASVAWNLTGTRRLYDAIGSVRAVEELQISLFQATRYHQLIAETGDDRWAVLMRKAETELQERMAEARSLVDSPEEQALLEELTEELEAIRRDVLEQPPSLRTIRRTDVIDATDKADALIALNEQSANATMAATRRWSSIGAAVSIAAIAIALLGVPSSLLRARRMIYRPVRDLRAELVERPADSDDHLPVQGPEEIQQIIDGINLLIDRRAELRAQQLTFLAAVAHDLRNPMASLQTAAELATRGVTDETQHRRLEVILRQVRRLNRLVGDLLELSRIGAGNFDLVPVERDLREVVRETADLFEDASEGHPIRLELPAAPVIVRHDPTRIGQILSNLVSNAIKYSPSGSPVDVRLRELPDSVAIDVEDRGIGINPEEHELIFSTFGRSLGVASEIPGVGLGLSVARQLARAHGGDIELESEPGAGSTFTLVLPRREEADRQPAGR